MIGTGIFVIPKGFSQAGYVVGLIATLATGALVVYTHQILVSHIEYE